MENEIHNDNLQSKKAFGKLGQRQLTVSTYAGDLFIWLFVTNIINLLEKRLSGLTWPNFFIFNPWKLKMMKNLKYKDLKSVVIQDEQ